MLKHAIYSYIPKRRHHRARLSDYDQYEIAQKIWAFKSGRNYAKRWAANVVCDTLSLMDMTDTIFLCIPASCQHTHARRFKKFSAMVCSQLHAENGYNYIHVMGKRTKAHISKTHDLAENTDKYIEIDESKLAGKKVVIFDDVTTSCKTANAFIERIRKSGAKVKLALFLPKTQSFYNN